MNNFASIFEELSKLYEENTQEAVVENFERDNGVAAWSKNAISWYTQAAKELGLSDYTMKLVGYGNDTKVVVTAVKNGKKLSAEEPNEAVTHEVQNVEDAKEFIKYIFPDLTESITEAAEDEIVEDEIPVEEVPVEEPVVEEESRRLVIECDKCGALVIKDEADIVVDEETDLVNVEDECQFCEEANGYKIIGVVAPYEVAEEVVNEEPVEEEPVEEAVEESKTEDLTEAKTTKQRLIVIEPGYQYKDKDGSIYTLYGDECEEDDTGITYNWDYVEAEDGDIYIF